MRVCLRICLLLFLVPGTLTQDGGDLDLLDALGPGSAVDPGYDPQGGADQPQDPDLLWGQILKMLNANIPEEFYMWMSNLKHTLASLLERAMDLLQAMP